MDVLTTDRLSKRYKNRLAVDEVSMHIEKGDIYGFVGENGAGKTTVIRMITGLAAPTKGTYALNGVQCTDSSIYREKRKMGAIVEAASVSKNMTAMENLRLQCMITGTTKTDAELKALLELVGLQEEAIRNKKAGSFSLGMRQRLGLAIVMVSDAEFILLDEPMNGLDPQGFIDVREAILNLHEAGVTFLISSHLLSELEKICTKVGVISHGRLLEEISIDELHKKARKSIIITADPEAEVLKGISEVISVKDAEVEGDRTILYDSIDINELMRVLVDKGITVRAINVVEETIEDYYINLVGKGAAR